MTQEELLKALRRTSVDRERCFGCGYEHNCFILGCAINHEAAVLIQRLSAEVDALRNPPNEPLTLDELREMDGEPVWLESLIEGNGEWAIINIINLDGIYILCPVGAKKRYGGGQTMGEYGKTWRAYRQKPEEASHGN